MMEPGYQIPRNGRGRARQWEEIGCKREREKESEREQDFLFLSLLFLFLGLIFLFLGLIHYSFWVYFCFSFVEYGTAVMEVTVQMMIRMLMSCGDS